MDKKLLFIYNPVSGKGQARAFLADIVEIYSLNDYSVTVHPTKCKGDGFEFIKEHAHEYDLIAVCGGDGMLNEAVSGLMHTEEGKRPALAYMPSGSTNDFAGTVRLLALTDRYLYYTVYDPLVIGYQTRPFSSPTPVKNDQYYIIRYDLESGTHMVVFNNPNYNIFQIPCSKKCFCSNGFYILSNHYFFHIGIVHEKFCTNCCNVFSLCIHQHIFHPFCSDYFCIII